MKKRSYRAVLIVTIVGALLSATSVTAQLGFHGNGHDTLHHWYETLRDWKGRPCCNDKDCRPTQSRYGDRGLEVLLDGEWTIVPPHKVLPETSPDARTHVCSPGRESNYPRGFIFCVVLGPGV